MLENNTGRVGVIGAGYISTAYLKSRFPQFEIVSCGDVIPENAEMRAREFGIQVASVESILADPSIDIILNLTIPQSHVSVGLAALEAGKHVYSEKPLGLSRDEARPLLDAAAARKLRVGCAPDTFLGGAHQTARKLVDEGAIGRPIGGSAFFMSSGPESWHLGPEFPGMSNLCRWRAPVSWRREPDPGQRFAVWCKVRISISYQNCVDLTGPRLRGTASRVLKLLGDLKLNTKVEESSSCSSSSFVLENPDV
jgi:predicted dehydrogenase